MISWREGSLRSWWILGNLEMIREGNKFAKGDRKVESSVISNVPFDVISIRCVTKKRTKLFRRKAVLFPQSCETLIALTTLSFCRFYYPTCRVRLLESWRILHDATLPRNPGIPPGTFVPFQIRYTKRDRTRLTRAQPDDRKIATNY